ncbi:DUF7118 family protein [Natronorarus salvus]|uniref:DUF7118 family protein n=1 Tax=Natronorarus salvus TaxID=3117733 RepID=UPI002F2660CD
MSDAPLARLVEARADLAEVEADIEAIGEERLESLEEARERLARLFSRREEEAVGTGREAFAAFASFKLELASIVDSLDEELPEREAIERAAAVFEKNRLSEGDFARAREELDPVDETLSVFEEREEARESYRDARRVAATRIEELDDRIGRLERLSTLDPGDLDAPIEELRGPIESYDDEVSAAFSAFLSTESAREVVSFLRTTEQYPLVPFDPLPPDLVAYVEGSDAGEEPFPTLLHYAEFSRTKLSHYVHDPDALKRAVATNRTAIERLDSTPLEIGWPPPTADDLRWRIRELRPVVDRFAGEGLIVRLREADALSREPAYERCRAAALARSGMADEERALVGSGRVEEELVEARERRAALCEQLG